MMKKLFVLVLTALLACPLFANEAAVTKVLTDLNELGRTMQVQKMLAHYDKSCTSTSVKGEVLTYDKISVLANIALLFETPDVKLSQLMSAVAKMTGEKISAEQLEMCKALDDTDRGKALVKTMQTAFKADKEKQIKKLSIEADSFKLVSVKVNENQAEAVYTCIDAQENRPKQTTVNLIKKDGKWLIVKEVSKYI